MGLGKCTVETSTPLSRALSAAVSRSGISQKEVARRCGLHVKSLERYLSGERQPKLGVRDEIFRVCAMSAATAVLAAELGRPELIGSSFLGYLDALLRQVCDNFLEFQAENAMPIDARAAASDASLLLAHWSMASRRRQTFLDEHYARTGDWLDWEGGRMT